jgi:hypothetical protein
VAVEQELPEADDLPVGHLLTTLQQRSASYKFYWFLAILEAIKQDIPQPVPIDFLLAQMVALAWYPNVFFRLSFGSADRLAATVFALQLELSLKLKTSVAELACLVQEVLKSKGRSELKSKIREKGRYVPFRFLQPWFAGELAGLPDSKVNDTIVKLAAKNFQNHRNLPPYRFSADGRSIELQPRWRGYFRRHFAIVQSFVVWHLAKYLQSLNPNVPAIPNKLFPPEERGDLARAREFWAQVPELRCIYTGRPLSLQEAEIDHFLPWSFVAHDLLWNLIPVASDANAKKSDALPDLEYYLPALAQRHYAAIQQLLQRPTQQAKKLLEDYEILVGNRLGRNLRNIDEAAFLDSYRHTFVPLAEIASNMGFQTNWVYR